MGEGGSGMVQPPPMHPAITVFGLFTVGNVGAHENAKEGPLRFRRMPKSVLFLVTFANSFAARTLQ